MKVRGCLVGVLTMLASAAPGMARAQTAPADQAFYAFLKQDAAPREGLAGTWPAFSEASIAAQTATWRRRLAALPRTIDRARLSPAAQVQYNIYRAALGYRIEEAGLKEREFFISGNIYNDAAALASPLTAPAPLDATGVAQWLARLKTLPAALGQYETVANARVARGVVMVQASYPQVARGFRAFATGAPCGGTGENPLLAAFESRTKALPDAERSAAIAAASTILTASVCPAYAGFADRVAAMAPTGRTEGYWKQPGGRDDYRTVVELSLAERVDPDAIFKTGQQEAVRLKADILQRATKLGYTGDIAGLVDWMNTRPGESLPQTEAGRAAFVSQANTWLSIMTARLPGYFLDLPSRDAVIRPIVHAGPGGGTAIGAQYLGPPRDGSAPVISLSLPGSERMQLWGLGTIIYHEGVPGHHLQNDIEDRVRAHGPGVGIPFYPAFSEGWAVYSQDLADEMGGYANDYERIGFERYCLELAVRLVVDTGVNFEGWTTPQAEDYQRQTLGSVSGTGRHLNWPGQALGYYWGYLHFKRLRAQAEQALGPRFDLRQFHHAILANGSVPFSVVDQAVATWIADRKAG